MDTKRAPKISKRELETALEFLNSDPIGKRLRAAEHTLTLLLKDQLPRLRQYVFNACFELREISDPAGFQETAHAHSSPNETYHTSRNTGYVRVRFEKDQIKIVLFYDQQLSNSEAVLFSRSLSEVTAVTYAALGLDMTGMISINEQVLSS